MRKTSITSVLFDADGVLQRGAEAEKYAELIDDPGEASQLLSRIFDIEAPYLTKSEGFEDALGGELEQLGVEAPLSEVLAVWTDIRPSPEIFELVERVSANGTEVALATNQERYRYEHMYNTLNYRVMFQHAFVSYQIGHTKPSSTYFEYIIDTIGCEPNQLLFIDDNESNVTAAAECGIVSQSYHLDEGPERMIEILRNSNVPGI